MPTHKKTESERFKGPAKYAEYLFARALITVLQRLPIGLAYRLGRVVGWLAWRCLKRRRETVQKNLEIVNEWMCAQSADGGCVMNEDGNSLRAEDGNSLRAEGGDSLRAEDGNLKPEKATASQTPLRSQVSGFSPQKNSGLKSQVSALKKTQVSGFSPQKNSGLKSRVSALKKSQVSALKKTQVSGFRFQPSKKLRSQVSGLSPHPSLELAQQVRAVFLRAGANLFAGFTFNRMSPEQAARHIEIEGLEHLKAALAKGKGAIVLLAHMGPWEALTQLPGFAKQQYGIEAPFGAMYRPLNNTYLDNWFKAQREGQGTRLFSRRDGFHKPVDFLRSGGMLGILSDQKMREGPRAPYFGVEVPSSPIPGLFHRRSGAPLCALSVKTLAPTRWQFKLRPVPVAPETDLTSREALAGVCNQAIADSLAESPLDGFWLHARF